MGHPTVALLRGINVGGHAKLPMARLRELATGLGLAQVRTYLQSGNLLFEVAELSDLPQLARSLEDATSDATGSRVHVLLRSRDELAAVAEANPLVDAASDFAKLHVMFLDRAPEAGALATLDPDRSKPDEFTVIGREIFLHYRDGAGRSKLTGAYFERRLGVVATARNWNTVTRLLAMMDQQDA